LINRQTPAEKPRSTTVKAHGRAEKKRLTKRAIRPAIKKPREKSIPLRP